MLYCITERKHAQQSSRQGLNSTHAKYEASTPPVKSAIKNKCTEIQWNDSIVKYFLFKSNTCNKGSTLQLFERHQDLQGLLVASGIGTAL